MIPTEVWAIITVLAATVSSLAVYINRMATGRIVQLETENEKLKERLDKVSDRTLSTTDTLERVVNAALEREKLLLLQLADGMKASNTGNSAGRDGIQ